MRIVQVIDSLETGGAERMAVNYANALVGRIEFSGLVATRAEGKLRSQVDSRVGYLFLKKKHVLDFSAVGRLWRYCLDNKIDYIHAHSTSYFIALMVKIFLPKVHIIWHDHNGNSEFLEVREAVPLNVCSYFFKGIIVVNNQLKAWALRELHCPHVYYIPNFTTPELTIQRITTLQGTPGKRILHLANLREQKNHFFLISVAKMIRESHPDWTFHLVGKDFEDDYSASVHAAIKQERLQEHVIVYGSKNDTTHIIQQADIAILTSKSEGLPVALLEYALQSKPVVMTQVGEIPLMVKDGQNGFLVPKTDPELFAQKLRTLIVDAELRATFGARLHQLIIENHSEDAAVTRYLKWIQEI